MAIQSIGAAMVTLLAAADLSAKQFYLVKVDTAGKAALGTAGSACIGPIAEPNTTSGEVGIVTMGIYPVIYGDTVVAGDNLASSSTGKAVPAVAGDNVVGVALESGSVNEIRAVLLLPKGPGSFPTGERGDFLFYNGANWVVIHHGTAGQVIQSGGHGADPTYLTRTDWWIFYINLVDLANGDIITEWIPGFAGTITDFLAIVAKAATTADKLSTLNLEIETTNVTGGALALTSANCTPKGAQVAASAITAGNTFTAAQKISIEASSTTAFQEGAVWLMIKFTRP